VRYQADDVLDFACFVNEIDKRVVAVLGEEQHRARRKEEVVGNVNRYTFVLECDTKSDRQKKHQMFDL